MVVVDADSAEALAWIWRRLPWTPWQTRTARGFHLYYRYPDVPVRNRARIETGDGRLALDLRADGGYVIAPGSLHASGSHYEQAGNWNMPRFWPGWLARPEVPVRQAPAESRRIGEVVERARRYLARIPKPEIGAGSDIATFRAACRLTRGFDLAESTTVALIQEWAGGRPGWTRDWIASKVQAALRYGTEPTGGLR